MYLLVVQFRSLASGGDHYPSACVKVMRFNPGSRHYSDHVSIKQQTCCTKFQQLAFTASLEPCCFFMRRGIFAGGSVLEGSHGFDLLSLMFTALKTQDEQLGIASEGFFPVGEIVKQQYAYHFEARRALHVDDALIAGSVPEARQVLFKPMLGILKQDKHTPLR